MCLSAAWWIYIRGSDSELTETVHQEIFDTEMYSLQNIEIGNHIT